VIRLKPRFAPALLARAGIFEELSEYDHAISDINAYLILLPNDASGRVALGLVQWASASFGASATSFDQAVALNPKFAYAALWRWIATRSQGSNDTSLKKDSENLDLAKWPGPVVNLFLGQTNVEGVVQAATLGDASNLPGQKCEADFYGGEWLALQNNPAGAKPMPRRDECIRELSPA
jgi:lipoprotein NlpI